jgi:hypothetical protein
MVVKTYEDGWGCVPQLKRVVRSIDMLGDHVYEIKNCVRASDIEYMVAEMKAHLQVALDTLDTIDTDKEYKTIEDIG